MLTSVSRRFSSNAATSPLSLRRLPDGPTHFGREVLGVDLATADLPAEDLVAALYEHGALLFRNQGHLTPANELRFARLFTHDTDDLNGGQSYTGGAGTQHRLPDYPAIALVGTYCVRNFYGLTAESKGVYGGWHPDQKAWHCDGLADTNPPPDITTMRCLINPPQGGDTLFASTVKAAELLPPSLDPPPDDVRIRYRLFEKYEIAREGTHLRSARGSKGQTDAHAWDVNLAGGTSVPLVIRERVTGRRTMVGTYHVDSLGLIDDPPGAPPRMGFGDANRYAAEAWRPGLAEDVVYRHRWRVGDVVAWSNRLVIHTATSTAAYHGEDRLHTRIRMRSQPEHAPVSWKDSSDVSKPASS